MRKKLTSKGVRVLKYNILFYCFMLLLCNDIIASSILLLICFIPYTLGAIYSMYLLIRYSDYFRIKCN